MLIWGLLMLAQTGAEAGAASPDAEALALGQRLAETGPLASLLPMIAAKETDEMVAAHPELSAAEQSELRRIAAQTMAEGAAKLHAAQGVAYAKALPIADLRALVAFNTSSVAGRYRAAQPAAIAGAMGAMGGLDYKRDTLAAFCAKTGKACAK